MLWIVGATACGKTELAVRLVGRAKSLGILDLPILNADSIQVYRGVDVGSGKPSASQLSAAPHRLLGHIEEGKSYAVGDYRREVLAEIDDLNKKGLYRVVLVGGSGFYLQAIEKGLTQAPPSDPALRAELEERADREGLGKLHQEFAARDPERAARVSPADRYRILRGLETMALQPLTLTQLDRQLKADREAALSLAVAEGGLKQNGFAIEKTGLFRERDSLRLSVERRAKEMLENGLLEETQSLRERGLGAWPPLKSVGYREAQACLDGAIARSDLLQAIVTSTMQLAKKQMTWFRRDKAIVWFDADKEFAEAEEKAFEWLKRNST